jgi:hypothetical protein
MNASAAPPAEAFYFGGTKGDPAGRLQGVVVSDSTSLIHARMRVALVSGTQSATER